MDPMDASALPPIPPVMWTVLQECVVLWRSELLLSRAKLQAVHKWACKWGTEMRSSSSRQRVQFEEFMNTMAHLFEVQTSQQEHMYVFDVCAVFFHDCHGIVLSSDQWNSLKRMLHTSKTQIANASSAPIVHSPALVLVPHEQSNSLHHVRHDRDPAAHPLKRLCNHDRGSSVQSDAAGHNPDAECESPAATDTNDEAGSLSVATSTRSHGSHDGSASSQDALRTELRSLQLQIGVLRNMVVAKDAKIVDQRKTIKQLQNKNFKACKRVERLKSCITRDLQQQSCGKDFSISRVQTQKSADKQLSQLKHGRLEAYLDDVEGQHQTGDDEDDEEVALATGWLTPQGTIALAIRRNLSNCAARDIGLVVLEDTSKSTVLRAECKVGAALIASGRLFFEHWRQSVFHSQCMHSSTAVAFTVLHYRQDATNHRHKMISMELEASYCLAQIDEVGFVEQTDFSRLKRLSDVIPVTDGTGLGTLALSEKMLTSLGAPTWTDFLSQHAEGKMFLGCSAWAWAPCGDGHGFKRSSSLAVSGKISGVAESVIMLLHHCIMLPIAAAMLRIAAYCRIAYCHHVICCIQVSITVSMCVPRVLVCVWCSKF